jgi:single-strand DNA-binding protein
MPAFNSVILMGNLTRDPELKHTSSGSAVCAFGIAINSKYKSKSGEQKEEADFFDIEAWGKTAELCSQYLKKGSPVLIEGRLKQDRWEDESGQKRSKVKIVCNGVQFLSGGQKKEEDEGGYSEAPPF